MSPQLRLEQTESPWVEIRDGDRDLRPFYDRHYSARRYADGRRPRKIMGPGEYILLVTPEFDALFGWRRCKRDDGQDGVECSVFRNEGDRLSSSLILAAEPFAWARWPGERLFTYIDETKIRHKRDPGRCFLKAGWRYVHDAEGNRYRSKNRGLLLLEKVPPLCQICGRPKDKDHRIDRYPCASSDLHPVAARRCRHILNILSIL